MNSTENVSDERLAEMLQLAQHCRHGEFAALVEQRDIARALAELQALRSLPTENADRVEAIAWNDVPTAPKNGTMLRLLVKPGDDFDGEGFSSFDDSDNPYETIGFNNLKDTGDDEWQFAGWDWNHDCITQGFGEVIGWLPFHAKPSPVSGGRK